MMNNTDALPRVHWVSPWGMLCATLFFACLVAAKALLSLVIVARAWRIVSSPRPEDGRAAPGAGHHASACATTSTLGAEPLGHAGDVVEEPTQWPSASASAVGAHAHAHAQIPAPGGWPGAGGQASGGNAVLQATSGLAPIGQRFGAREPVTAAQYIAAGLGVHDDIGFARFAQSVSVLGEPAGGSPRAGSAGGGAPLGGGTHEDAGPASSAGMMRWRDLERYSLQQGRMPL
jgi:hypothetical protein